MVGPAVDFDRNCGVRQTFDHVADFQIILAVSVWREPPRRDAMNSIAPDKWIIDALRQFVAQRGYVFKPRNEQSRADPTGIVEHISFFAEAVAGIARLEVVSVKAENAALIWIPIEVEIRIGEEESRNIFCGDIAGVLSGANR